MELLRQSLVERQRKEILEQIRQAVQFLEGRNEIGRGLFTKGPESRPRESGYRYQHDRRTWPGPWRPLPSAPAAVCRPLHPAFRALWGRNPSL